MSYKILSANKILESYQNRLSGIRAGRVTVSTLDSILVDAYGSKLQIREVATISSPEPTQLLLTPFDKSLNTALEKAIRDSSLGVNPVNDGAGVRLNFPPMTEENRKQRVKEVGQALEEARIVVRSTRQDLLKSKKHAKDASEISEDDLKRFEGDLQKDVEQINKELEELAKNKENEIMKL